MVKLEINVYVDREFHCRSREDSRKSSRTRMLLLMDCD
jgi:hypothetical protein